MSSLIAAGKPLNLRSEATMVESDVYDICNRVREIDPDLTIHVNPDGHRFKFSVQHVDKVGNEYFVCGADELDARLVDRIQYMLHVPFEKRYAEVSAYEDKLRADLDKQQWDKFYENMGQRMFRQLATDGFNNRVHTAHKSAKRQRAGR